MQRAKVLKDFTVPGFKAFKAGEVVALEESTFKAFEQRGIVEAAGKTKAKKAKKVKKVAEEPKKKDV